MAIGFGTTDGTSGTDVLDTGFTGFSAQRTWAFRCRFRSGGIGTSLGRIWASPTPDEFFAMNGGRITFFRAWGSGEVNWQILAANTINTDYSVVLSYDSSVDINVPIAYVNGSESTLSTAATRTSPAAVNNVGNYRIGNRPDQARGWDGWISSFAIWNEIIPANMALAISGNFSPLIYTKNLVYYNPMVVTNSPDIIGARTQTLTGARSFSHPPVSFELGGAWS